MAKNGRRGATEAKVQASRQKPLKIKVGSQPKGALHPIGMAYEDEAGTLFLRRARIEGVKSGGAPKKMLRDVALTLHFEYMIDIDALKKNRAASKTGEIFPEFSDPEKRIPEIVKRTRSTTLQEFTKVVAFDRVPGLTPGNNGRVVAAFLRRDNGTRRLEGFAVHWGEREARLVALSGGPELSPA
jgi:hypothetical protein